MIDPWLQRACVDLVDLDVADPGHEEFQRTDSAVQAALVLILEEDITAGFHVRPGGAGA